MANAFASVDCHDAAFRDSATKRFAERDYSKLSEIGFRIWRQARHELCWALDSESSAGGTAAQTKTPQGQACPQAFRDF